MLFQRRNDLLHNLRLSHISKSSLEVSKAKELFSAIRGRLFSDNWWEAFLLKRRAPLADLNIDEIEIELCSRLFPISIDKISSGPEYLKKTERYIIYRINIPYIN